MMEFTDAHTHKHTRTRVNTSTHQLAGAIEYTDCISAEG